MNKKLLIILDPAHGEETPGKRSTDGRHCEYQWSRERLVQIEHLLLTLGYTVVWINDSIREIGLSNRVQRAELYAKECPDLTPLLISLHNDAAGDGSKWMQASGISVWTSKGRTTSDIYADLFIQRIPEWFPTVKQRIFSQTPLDKDFEANFTVLTGNYSALLIECLFQDNKDDVLKLENSKFQKEVEDWIVDSIEDCNEYVTKKMIK